MLFLSGGAGATRQTTLPVLNEAGKDLTGFQNITVYTFYAFGQAIGREILQTTAKTGGFEDRNGNNQPDLVEVIVANTGYLRIFHVQVRVCALEDR